MEKPQSGEALTAPPWIEQKHTSGPLVVKRHGGSEGMDERRGRRIDTGVGDRCHGAGGIDRQRYLDAVPALCQCERGVRLEEVVRDIRRTEVDAMKLTVIE